MNGPEPPLWTLLPYASPCASTSLREDMKPAWVVNCASSGEYGAVRLILIVYWSTTSTLAMGASAALCTVFGWVMLRSRFHFAVAASHGEPSWNVTPLRRFMVTDFWSAEMDHVSASPGTILRLRSVPRRRS